MIHWRSNERYPIRTGSGDGPFSLPMGMLVGGNTGIEFDTTLSNRRSRLCSENSSGLSSAFALIRYDHRFSSVALSGAITQVRPGIVPDPDQRNRSSNSGKLVHWAPPEGRKGARQS